MKSEAIMTISIDTVPYGKGMLRTPFNIDLPLYLEDGYYVASYPIFNIEICEKTIVDVYKSFYEDIQVLWEEYANANDEELSKGAIELKHRLKESFYLAHSTDYDYQSSTPLYDYKIAYGYGMRSFGYECSESIGY